MNTVFANIRLKSGNIVMEKELDVNSIRFENGVLITNDKKYSILILGDNENTPIGFTKDVGDGYPRILADWRGMVNEWSFDDVVLNEIE